MNGNNKPVYLDYHATTPVDPVVLEAMMPFFSHHFGNPSSRSHPYGWQASEAVQMARHQVARMLHTEQEEVYFTSGSTEGLNMLIKGYASSLQHSGRHIISVKTEHPAVLDTLQWLGRNGFEITLLDVDPNGLISPGTVLERLRSDTIMVIVMWANNETGVIHDVQGIGAICRDHQAIFISDATQAAGKIHLHPEAFGVDALAISAHKMYGPKGTGAVWIRGGLKKPLPLIHGGGHENGLRSGTLNVPGIVGLGKACELAIQGIDQFIRVSSLRDHFEHEIISGIESASINGDPVSRLPSVSSLKIAHIDSQSVMTRLRTRLSISSGSACSSAHPEPSHVLLAMGLSSDEAKSSIRVSFGLPTTREEVDLAAALLKEAIFEYRKESPVWQMYKAGIDLSAD